MSKATESHPGTPAPARAVTANLPPVARFPSGPRVREWARKHGFRDWMVARYAHIATPQHLPRLLEGLQKRPPSYIRVNPLRGKLGEIRARLESRGFEFAANELDRHVLRIRHAPISPGATQEHLMGLTTPQDLASASAPLALEAKPGDIVVDLAAAPGIKTLHIAGDLQEEGTLVAVEPDPQRMRALRFNLERGGVTTTLLRQHPGQELPGQAWADKVLLDAPCTGEGTLPKDRSRRRMEPEEIANRAALQRELLDAADRILKPGGRLVYATCALAPEENEAQIQYLIERGYTVEPLPFDACGGESLAPAVTQWPGIELEPQIAHARRFLPGVHPTLGFFVARLRKEATP